MNYSSIAIAGSAATVVYFIYGFLVFGLLLRSEYARYPALYRTPETMKPFMALGMISTWVGILVVAVLFAMTCTGSSSAVSGAGFGVLIGVFAVCGFVLHNHVNLNIGLRLTIAQAAAYFVEWVIVGTVIGAIHKTA